MGSEVHFVCDTYQSPSIKDLEREERAGKSSMSVIIGGPAQKLKDFNDGLSFSQFRTSFLLFLVEEWSKNSYHKIIDGHKIYVGIATLNSYHKIIDGHKIYVGIANEGWLFEAVDGRVKKTGISHLQCITNHLASLIHH